jgi:hypothetical protein
LNFCSNATACPVNSIDTNTSRSTRGNCSINGCSLKIVSAKELEQKTNKTE